MSELEKEIREMLRTCSAEKIEYKDFHFKTKTIAKVPYELVEGYGEVLNFNTAHYVEKLLKHMYHHAIDHMEYKEL